MTEIDIYIHVYIKRCIYIYMYMKMYVCAHTNIFDTGMDIIHILCPFKHKGHKLLNSIVLTLYQRRKSKDGLSQSVCLSVSLCVC